jgi:hypothetical protein
MRHANTSPARPSPPAVSSSSAPRSRASGKPFEKACFWGRVPTRERRSGFHPHPPTRRVPDPPARCASRTALEAPNHPAWSPRRRTPDPTGAHATAPTRVRPAPRLAAGSPRSSRGRPAREANGLELANARTLPAIPHRHPRHASPGEAATECPETPRDPRTLHAVTLEVASRLFGRCATPNPLPTWPTPLDRTAVAPSSGIPMPRANRRADPTATGSRARSRARGKELRQDKGGHGCWSRDRVERTARSWAHTQPMSTQLCWVDGRRLSWLEIN